MYTFLDPQTIGSKAVVLGTVTTKEAESGACHYGIGLNLNYSINLQSYFLAITRCILMKVTLRASVCFDCPISVSPPGPWQLGPYVEQ